MQYITLAYNKVDQEIATKFLEGLRPYGLQFNLVVADKDKPETTIYEQLKDEEGLIFILLSYGFLRSAVCMDNMYSFFQNNQDNIVCLTTPTYVEDEQTGETVSVQPDVEKIGSIIQYINFWQDRYLNMRQQKRDIAPENKASFDTHLKKLRAISVEIGEFLRLARTSTYFTIQRFSTDNFHPLFELLGATDFWESKQEEFTDTTIEIDATPTAITDEEDHTPLQEEIEQQPPQDTTTTTVEKEVTPTEEEEDAVAATEEEEETQQTATTTMQDNYTKALAVLKANGDKEEIKQLLQQALVDDPKHKFAWYDLALLYHNQGEEDLARQAYQSATANNPELKTMENDQAFGVMLEIDTSTSSYPKTELPQSELLTLEALKENVAKLSALVHSREEEIKAKKASQPGRGKVVMITGTTSGIGLASAHKFAENGYNLIITGRRKEKLQELSNDLQQQYDIEVLPLTFDVRSLEAITTLFKKLEGEWRNIDILINNAGKAKGLDPIHEGKLEHWEEMIDTNLRGLLYITREVSRIMVERKTGHIINTGSTSGKEVYPNGNVYCATKFAVDALTKSIRMDLHTHNVRVSQVAPAHVETEFALVRFDGNEDRAQIYDDFQPLTAEDVANSIYFIASQPAHVNILDITLQSTQQPSAMIIDRSGR